MISGFRHINKNTSRNGNGCKWGDRFPPKIYEKNSDKFFPEQISAPYNISFRDINYFDDFQNESLDIIKTNFNVVNYNDIKDDDIVIFNYGEQILDDPYHISSEGYQFVQDLFLKNININESKHKNKKYFVSRNKSHELSGNNSIKRRQIINEHELLPILEKFNIEMIYLEDFNTIEKIDIFNNSSLIISPNSGSLTFTIFSGKNLKVIELNVDSPGQISYQYENQCHFFNVPYYKFVTQKIDDNDNMIVNVDEFDTFLKQLL
jgi:capsular polysaccharide biosynthesis protein